MQATEQMISQDNVNFMFGAFGSGAAKAASTVSEKYKVPTLAATASSSAALVRFLFLALAQLWRTLWSSLV